MAALAAMTVICFAVLRLEQLGAMWLEKWWNRNATTAERELTWHLVPSRMGDLRGIADLFTARIRGAWWMFEGFLTERR